MLSAADPNTFVIPAIQVIIEDVEGMHRIMLSCSRVYCICISCKYLLIDLHKAILLAFDIMYVRVLNSESDTCDK